MITTSVRWRCDDGRVSVFFAVGFLAVILLIGLFVDGGGRLRAIQRADSIAAEAARAAGQAINGPQAIGGGIKIVDPSRAVIAAQAYLDSAGVSGIIMIADDRQHLEVTVSIVYRYTMLSLLGYADTTVTGHATAVLLTG